MEPKQLIRTSKFLSKHLRHAPEEIGLTLQEGGWVEVEDLLAACARKGVRLTRAELEEVVAGNDKQRYSFDESGARIRANQGHSVEVDLQLEQRMPPPVLYHGTADHNVESVLKNGLQKRARHHVHLSLDVETARRVGARHGKPVIFSIDACKMQEAGFAFYCSENGVWLTDEVPPQFLRLLETA